MLTFCLVAGFLAAWIALYVLIIRPKLVAFRYTAGIYAELDTIEAGLWAHAVLWLKGVKVLIAGVLTSAAPMLAVFYERMTGVDWSQFVTGETAKLIAAAIAVLGILGPMLMVALHNGARAEAAAIEPRKE